jgi:hypothetical protein
MKKGIIFKMGSFELKIHPKGQRPSWAGVRVDCSPVAGRSACGWGNPPSDNQPPRMGLKTLFKRISL